MGIKFNGGDKARRRLERIADRLARATDAACEEFAEEVKVHMQGIVAVDTGTLKESIEVVKVGDTYTVGPRGVDYAGFVENGTSRSPAQPYVAPTIQWAKQVGPKRIARKIEGAIT